jgi:hypothetical protein
MNSKQFLILGGAVLVLVALLGMMGIIGPTAAESIFGSTWWFDPSENVAHLVLGVVAIIAAFVFPASMQKPLVIIVGLFALLVGLYSIAGPVFEGKEFLGAQLQNPTDTILHLGVGLWALLAGLMGKSDAPESMASSSMSSM